MRRLVDLTDPAQLHGDDAVGRANCSLVAAIIAQRGERVSEAQQLAASAATTYAALGWPMLQAQALETAGRPADALVLYERCGAVADVHRLAPPNESSYGHGNGLLSSRERTIADFVSLGMTNIQIADRLALSTKTVEKNMSGIFAKLGIRSRAELAAFVSREQQKPA